MLIDVEGDNFKNQVLNSNDLKFVVFSAVWCGPCQLLHPILEKLSDELDGQFDFFAVDVDEARELCGYYEVDVVPTVIAIEDQNEVGRFSGLKTEEEVLEFIKNCKA